MAGLSFDPYAQNVTLIAPDGVTPIYVPIAMIDDYYFTNSSMAINYGCQLGACIIMVLLLLIVTPKQNLLRRSSVLYLLGLLACISRTIPQLVYLVNPFNEFYGVWSGDTSKIRTTDLINVAAGNTLTLLLLIVVEISLANQAWAIVRLWPRWLMATLSVLCFLVTLITVGMRFAFVIVQTKLAVNLESDEEQHWVSYWMVITNAFSIFWYSALFNAKLATHMVRYRSILPSRNRLSPMDVLVMTNGVLMVVPGLEWSHIGYFEPSSLILTSVVLVLPLGSLVAQRISASSTSLSTGKTWQTGTRPRRRLWSSIGSTCSTAPISDVNKAPDLVTSTSTQIGKPSVRSACGGGVPSASRETPLSLDYLWENGSGVRVDIDLEQRVDPA